ncbi:tryptophan-rich sensory protein [Antribacter gilvus]|uniref:tryptophan-rich sensory protein n=1 Tax=Antribacter gilvus TaxID=2304675 RepID=UPI0030B8647D
MTKNQTDMRAKDRSQQIIVTASFLVCLVGSMIGVGVLGGTPIASAADGALAADATLLAPASGAFSVWTVVYLGLAGYTALQWFPTAASAARQRLLRLPVAGTMLLNATWILAVQAGWIWVSVAVIAALLALLCRVLVILMRSRASGALERLLVDGTLGIYLGWVCVATAANVAAALTSSGFDGGGLDPEWWAVSTLVVVGGIGIALAARSRGRIAVAAAIAWGLAWIAVARWATTPNSEPTATAAGAAAVAVLGVTLVLRVRAARQTGAVRA